jgi:archaeosortase B (VPXXXP-CTERM-specific)
LPWPASAWLEAHVDVGSGAASPNADAYSHAGRQARVVAFVALLIIFVVAVAIAPVSVVKPAADGTAAVAGAVIGAVGIDNTVDANLIYLDKRTLLVGRDCTAAYLIAVYAALVLTYPASRRDKALAFAVGVPALLLANMLRLVGAAGAAELFPSRFEIIHDYVFQVLLALSVLVVWLVWIDRLRANEI